MDAGGNAVDVVAWGVADGIFQRGAVPAGHSLERRTAGLNRDRPDDFVENSRPTLGEGFALVAASSECTRTVALLLSLVAVLATPLLALFALRRPRL